MTIAVHRRALLLLDGLVNVLVARGHEVTASGDIRSTSLTVAVQDEAVALAVIERLDQRPHVLTPAESARTAKGYPGRIPKYDKFASGHLQVLVDAHRAGGRAWSDTKTRRLEDQLGRVVLAIEACAESKRSAKAAEHARLKLEAERREREAEARRLRLQEEARAQYRKELSNDLRKMAACWAEADTIRRFISAAEVALGDRRSPDVEAWLAWARTRAEELDPLVHPESVPKQLEPDRAEKSA